MSDEFERASSAYLEAKEKARAEYEGQTIIELAHTLKTLQDAKSAIDDSLKSINAAIEVVRIEMLPDMMDDAGISTMNITGLGRLQLTDDLQIQHKNKPGLMGWLNEHDMWDLVTETVNGSTFKASMRKRIKDGKDLPPDDIVKITPFTRASIVKA